MSLEQDLAKYRDQFSGLAGFLPEPFKTDVRQLLSGIRVYPDEQFDKTALVNNVLAVDSRDGFLLNVFQPNFTTFIHEIDDVPAHIAVKKSLLSLTPGKMLGYLGMAVGSGLFRTRTVCLTDIQNHTALLFPFGSKTGVIEALSCLSSQAGLKTVNESEIDVRLEGFQTRFIDKSADQAFPIIGGKLLRAKMLEDGRLAVLSHALGLVYEAENKYDHTKSFKDRFEQAFRRLQYDSVVGNLKNTPPSVISLIKSYWDEAGSVSQGLKMILTDFDDFSFDEFIVRLNDKRLGWYFDIVEQIYTTNRSDPKLIRV